MRALSVAVPCLASAAAAVAATQVPLAGLATMGAALLAVTFGIHRGDLVPLLLSVGLFLTIADAALPVAVRLLLVVALFTIATAALLQDRQPPSPSERTVFLAVSAVVGWWTLQLANPNVPELAAGLAGMRKSVGLWLGLAIGAAMARRSSTAYVTRVVTGLLGASLGLALALHYLAPEIERTVARSADAATETYSGAYRLAGLFAGPFHASLAGVALTLLAVNFYLTGRHRALGCSVLGVLGLSAVLAAQVRSGYVALVVGLGYLLLAGQPRGSRRVLRGLAVAVVGGAATAVAFVSSASVASLTTTGTDTRFQGRFLSYSYATELLRQQPFVGYGSGSAGDTLDGLFVGRVHVTAHNMLLKMAFEGGAVGLVLVLVLLFAVWSGLRRSTSPISRGARAALLAAFVMGLTGSIVEALPVTLWLAVLAGGCLTGDAAVPAAGAGLPQRRTSEQTRPSYRSVTSSQS